MFTFFQFCIFTCIHISCCKCYLKSATFALFVLILFILCRPFCCRCLSFPAGTFKVSSHQSSCFWFMIVFLIFLFFPQTWSLFTVSLAAALMAAASAIGLTVSVVRAIVHGGRSLLTHCRFPDAIGYSSITNECPFDPTRIYVSVLVCTADRRSRHELWPFSGAAGSLNSWPLSPRRKHNRAVWLHITMAASLLCVRVYIGCRRRRESEAECLSFLSLSQSHSAAGGPMAEVLTWPCRSTSGSVLFQCATDGLSGLLSLIAAATRQHDFDILAQLVVCNLSVKWPLSKGGFTLDAGR